MTCSASIGTTRANTINPHCKSLTMGCVAGEWSFSAAMSKFGHRLGKVPVTGQKGHVGCRHNFEWQCPRGCPHFGVWRRWILQQIQNPQTVPPGEPHVVRFLDDGSRGPHGVTNDKIRQAGMVQRHRTQEQCFFLLSSTAILSMAVTFHNYVHIQVVHQEETGKRSPSRN
jgi:hypothetical protein